MMFRIFSFFARGELLFIGFFRNLMKQHKHPACLVAPEDGTGVNPVILSGFFQMAKVLQKIK